MTQPQTTRPYGLWASPLSPRGLSRDLRFADVQWDSDGATLVWLESRSDRSVLVCAPADGLDAPRDLVAELSVRAKVGYGGGDFTVANGAVFFCEAQSGRLYRQELAGGAARPITPGFGYAAAPACSPDGRQILFVHTYEDVDALAIVDAEGRRWPRRLVGGHDFYMQPCWHPAGRRIAYVAWNHPQMPWDGATLYLATLSEDADMPVIIDSTAIAGNETTAIFQPAFSPDGRRLAYVSDAGGWSHLHMYDLEQGVHRQLTAGEVEYGAPAWIQGLRTFGWSADGRSLVCIANERGVARLYRQPIAGGPADPIAGLDAYTWFEQPSVAPNRDAIALIASSGDQPPRIVVAEPDRTRVQRRSSTEHIAPESLAAATPITWETAGGAMSHGLLYLPPGYDLAASAAANRPPAIIRIHGGPTSQTVTRYQPQIQFFATRGYIVLDVNYRGSTGYGRAYMEALNGNWGVCDVEDAVSGARHLAEQGLVDAERIVIMGGSAGGYTVLEALCRAPGVFRAGLCLYGVANMFTLAADTHKFEARYLDTLLGPLPEAAAIYRERSPIFHADLLRDPIAIFQGEEDQVVPRAQSDSIVESLRQRGIPHEYHIYAGEGHGWRKQETIEAFYQAVDAFLRQYVLFA